MKLITQINDKISILGDKHHYVVKVQKGNHSKADYWHYPNLDFCFLEIFDYCCREKLANGKDKELKDVAQIILDVRQEILKTLKELK